MWYIYKMQYYLANKKNEIVSFIATWMDLEIILISEISQTEENKYMILLYIKFFKDDTCKLIYKKETDSQA